MTESSEFDREPAPQEGGGSDARDAARQASGEAAEREGETRGGDDESTATGNPAAAGAEGPDEETSGDDG